MDLFAPLLISFRLTFAGFAPAPPAPDRWFAEDKFQHFFLSMAITNLSYGTARLVGIDRGPATVAAGLTAGAAGIGKEIWDGRQGGHFSLKDLAWDGAGIATGLVLVSQAR